MKQPVIQRENRAVIEEVRTALLGFRNACQRIFNGEDAFGELDSFHAPDFVNHFSNKATNGESVRSDRKTQLASFRPIGEIYKKNGGAPMITPWHQILLRSESEALVSYEICMVGGRYWDRALCLQVWRKNDGRWQIVRQHMDQEGRIQPTPQQLPALVLDQAKQELLAALAQHAKQLAAEAESQAGVQFADLAVRHAEMCSETRGMVIWRRDIVFADDRDPVFEVWHEVWEKAGDEWKREVIS